MRVEVVEIVWMDDRTATWDCESTTVIQGVLNLHRVRRHGEPGLQPDKHIPIAKS